MDEGVTVNVDVLERVFPMLIQHLRETAGEDVSLDVDYYWSVPAPVSHDMNETPSELSVGQVSECMEWLTALARTPSMH